MSGRRWTPEAKGRVCALYGEGKLSGAAIAAVIRFEYGIEATKSAVIGVAFRAGLKARDNLQAVARRSAARVKSTRAARPRPRPVAKVAAAPKPKPAPMSAVAPVSLRIPIWEARDGQCKYIADDPKGGSATYRGHHAQHGSPWCPGHHKHCTVPERTRAFAWIPRRAA